MYVYIVDISKWRMVTIYYNSIKLLNNNFCEYIDILKTYGHTHHINITFLIFAYVGMLPR
jgi:hypothetical protein